MVVEFRSLIGRKHSWTQPIVEPDGNFSGNLVVILLELFFSDSWDGSDSRKRKSPKESIADMERRFMVQAEDLSANNL